MSKHYEVGPSTLPRHLACPGSRRLSQGIPDRAGAAADDGSDTHEVIARCFTAGFDARDLLGAALPYGGTMDMERAERVQACLDHYQSIPGDPAIEAWVDLTALSGEENGGTADFYSIEAHVDGTWSLHVRDYKDGHTPVTADTPQLKAYAAGIVAAQVREGFGLPATVTLGIVQPKVYTTAQVVEMTGEALNTWVADVLRPGIAATRAPDAPLIPGEKQCQWCRAKAICPALQRYTLEVIDAEVDDFADLDAPLTPLAPGGLTPELLSAVVLRAPLVRQWLDACESEAQRRLMDGVAVPDLKLVRGRRGNRAWAAGQEDAIVGVLTGNLGLAPESIHKVQLLSPAAILKLPAVKGREDLLASFITQAEGSLTVAPLSSKSEAVVVDVLADFSVI